MKYIEYIMEYDAMDSMMPYGKQPFKERKTEPP